MFDNKCLTAEWIDRKAEELHFPDKLRIEKAIRAFSILFMLSRNNCPFIVKGGLNMMLLFQKEFHRISDDADILCPPGTNIEDYISNFKDYGFTDCRPEGRFQTINDNLTIERKVLFYKSVYADDAENPTFVYFDIVYEENYFQQVSEIELKHPLFETAEGMADFVKILPLEAMLEDKFFSALDSSNRPDKMTRQIFDVGWLLNEADDIASPDAAVYRRVLTAYNNRAETILEKDYEKARLNAYAIATRGRLCPQRFAAQQEALDSLRATLYNKEYTLENAIADAAKIAYLATCMQYDVHTLEHYDGNPDSVRGKSIGEVMPSEINELRDSNPEAFFYWVKMEEIYLGV